MTATLQKGWGRVRASSGRHDPLVIKARAAVEEEGGVMASRNVQTYRAGHEAFNRRDFEAMTTRYAEGITWTDHAQGRTFRTSQEFKEDFLAGWVGSSSDIRITDPRYIDAGQTVVCTFIVAGTHDGPLGPLPPTGTEFALPLCEMWHFDSSGRVVGGDLYYDQVSLLTQLDLMPQPSRS
jgi:SnoaL-like domain